MAKRLQKKANKPATREMIQRKNLWAKDEPLPYHTTTNFTSIIMLSEQMDIVAIEQNN